MKADLQPPNYPYCTFKVADGCRAQGTCVTGNTSRLCAPEPHDVTYCTCNGGIATERICDRLYRVDYLHHPFAGECYPDGGPVQ